MDTLQKIFNKYKKLHWFHEYAENGIVNYDDFKKIIKEYESNQLKLKIEDLKQIIDHLWNNCFDSGLKFTSEQMSFIDSEINNIKRRIENNLK